ncbi:GGDEF domain-containing protein [Rhizobium sp. 0TCS1.26]|uniref:GGDEF domain-containing protein n=1 Tax=Rhizobium sp. 0TCS1.26 TaxID=3142623 RepID=UPI003D28BEE2
MNGANYFLIVNFLVGISFCTVFLIVSTRSRSRIAARWIAVAYAVASLSAIAELLVAYSDFPKVFAIAAFMSVLAGLLLIRVGVARLYGVPAHLTALAGFFCAAVVLDVFIYDLPRGTWLHALSYQTPFALAMLFSAIAVIRSSRREPIDRAMVVLLSVATLQFPVKAVIAVLVGAGPTAKDYVHSPYALVSQSMTGVFVVLVGLMLLSVFVLEIMEEARSDSEVDALSSVFNRRGFDAGCERVLRRQPVGPHALILCDIDHFKRVNDTFGHYSGDRVIRTFADLLSNSAPEDAVVGRLGGEEFCVMLPGVSLNAAMLFAQALRGSMAMQPIAGLPQTFRVTASFGVSIFKSSADMSAAMRFADNALYEAKAAGRNCVRQHQSVMPIAMAAG